MMYLFIFDTLIDLPPSEQGFFDVSLSWAGVEFLKIRRTDKLDVFFKGLL